MPRSRLLCAIALAAMAARATAMTVVPLSIADLTQSSAATVLATVEDVQVELVGDGHLRTLVRISIEQVIAGYLTDSELTLVEAGGVLDDDAEIIDAAPQFVAGERVVLFLARRTDGTWRTNHMLLGKFHIEGTDSGSARALQPLPSNTTVLLPPGVSAPNPVLPFDTLMESIRSAAAGFPVASVTAANTDSGYSAAFTLAVVNNQNGRFFDPDEGKP
ncbi:MAG TPA: hypothetical protein VMT89_09940, partial [Candidatus Acidoferrales bacterium]|nr:hypothetical protein [Candidatus Acidoferrales bacterium]